MQELCISLSPWWKPGVDFQLCLWISADSVEKTNTAIKDLLTDEKMSLTMDPDSYLDYISNTYAFIDYINLWSWEGVKRIFSMDVGGVGQHLRGLHRENTPTTFGK